MKCGSVTFVSSLPALPLVSLYASCGAYCSMNALSDTVAPRAAFTSTGTTLASRSMRNSISCELFARLKYHVGIPVC